MEQQYGNIGWQIFVYSSFIVTAVVLIIFALSSILMRKKAIKSMYNEGFFDKIRE